MLTKYYNYRSRVYYKLRYEGFTYVKFRFFIAEFKKFQGITQLDLINRLLFFVEENNIFKEIKISDDVTRIVSPLIYIKFDIDTLSIVMDSEGVRYSPSLDDFRIELSNIFIEFEFEDIYASDGIVTYVFSGLKTERIDYSEMDDFDVSSMNLIIPLNSKVSWNLNTTPHALIAGGTGKGKTYLIYHIIHCLLIQNTELYIFDPKNTKLGTLNHINNKINCYSNSNTINSDVFKVLRYLEGEILKRSDLLSKLNISNPRNLNSVEFDYRDLKLNPIVLIIDELKSLKIGLKDARKDFEDKLLKDCMLGRQLGIFVILATQKVNVDTISSDIKVNCSALFTVGNMDSISLVQIFGSTDGVEKISRSEIGVGYLSFDGDEVIRVEYPLINDIGNFENCTLAEKVIKLKRRKLYYQKQRHELRRLIDINLNGDCSFVTLTFREPIEDIEYANIEFNKFIKRLKYHLEKLDSAFELKYLAVNERTKKIVFIIRLCFLIFHILKRVFLKKFGDTVLLIYD
ncbi:MAG: FtsK/SpoIIIE domain-containing protein [Peptostreptococcus porci]|nr:FtsK/SpoIIIE domain-containing protein [Peptostreptococcus porci]